MEWIPLVISLFVLFRIYKLRNDVSDYLKKMRIDTEVLYDIIQENNLKSYEAIKEMQQKRWNAERYTPEEQERRKKALKDLLK